jgi:hypothetical protein
MALLSRLSLISVSIHLKRCVVSALLIADLGCFTARSSTSEMLAGSLLRPFLRIISQLSYRVDSSKVRTRLRRLPKVILRFLCLFLAPLEGL